MSVSDEVTLVVKTFNRPGCLDTCINSIRHFYPDIRIIVVNDGCEIERNDCEIVTMPFDDGS